MKCAGNYSIIRLKIFAREEEREKIKKDDIEKIRKFFKTFQKFMEEFQKFRTVR